MRRQSCAASAGMLVLMACVAAVSGQRTTIQVEGWEVVINERQPIATVLAFMDVKPGMVVGEIGAGTGRVTVWLADRVGPAGRIYANDIDAQALDHLKARCKREGLANVTTIIGAVDNPKLPPNSLDIAFMTNTYHHLEKPIELVRNILPSLKPGGRLVIVERDKDRSRSKDEATTRPDFIAQMDRAGFEVIKVDTSMREDNMYMARPKAARPAAAQ